MKIALYGNVCNNMFAIGKALRAFPGYDVHLYLPENANFNNLPENDESEMSRGYPSWIHRNKAYNLGAALCFWQNNIIRELNKYDLVILSSLSVALSPLLKKCKIFFFVTGGDLTVLPFREVHRTLLYSGRKNNVKPLIYEWLQRYGIRNTDRILTQPFSPFVKAIRRLNIPGYKVAQAYFPIIIDTGKFRNRPGAYETLDTPVRDQLGRFAFRLFHPSRIVINSHPHLVETGQWKRNDLLVSAFAQFIRNNRVKDAGLFLIDINPGADKGIEELKKLIKKLGIEEFVVWLKPGNRKGFTRNQLVDIYSCCDMVADDFGAGWFGSICVEGFSCSKPVLSYVDEDAMKKIYPWHPFLSSPTVEGNAALIARCYSDRNFAKSQGELGRKWALEYHSPENAGKLYVREFNRLLTEV